MIFYVTETQNDENHKKTAGVKARIDLEQIFEDCGMKRMSIPSIEGERESSHIFKTIHSHLKVASTWEERLSLLKAGDAIILQFPVVEHSVLLFNILKKIKRRGIRVILFIHDLELFRYTKRSDITIKRRLRLHFEETTVLSVADTIVIHNKKMREALSRRLNINANKMIVLDLFDYLIPDYSETKIKMRDKSGPIVISGNLHPQKAGYAYDLPDRPEFNLYGVNYQNQGKKNVEYKGSYSSEEIPFAMEGSFGLVWDGPSGETCEGPFGEYLKINNPHKASLYLASGIPVIIWEEAALADYITSHGAGTTIKSLDEIDDIISEISNDEYIQMKNNANKISKDLRNGTYTKKALEKLNMRTK